MSLSFDCFSCTRHHAISRQKPVRGADAPNYKRATKNLKNCYRPRPVTTCSGAEQREEPSNLHCSLALLTTNLAPPDCSEFKWLTLRPLLIRKQRCRCQQFMDLNQIAWLWCKSKVSTLPRILISARPYSTLRRKSRLFHDLAEKRLCFFRHAYMPRIRVSYATRSIASM